MNKKYLIGLSFTFLSSALLLGCNPVGGSSMSSQPTPPEPQTPYEEIYNGYSNEAYGNMSLAAVAMASHGYQGKIEQGYNGWKYNYVKQLQTSEMDKTDFGFEFEGASFNNKLMISTENVYAQREYTSTKTGEMVIYSSINVVEIKDKLTVEISINNGNTQIIELTSTGLKYFENTINVNANDKITFTLIGEGSIEYNPIIEATLTAKYYQLHQDLSGTHESSGAEKHYGDVHPYYDNGQMYMFHLATNGNYDTMLTTSKNMINFVEEPRLKKDDINGPAAPYYVLGVTKDGEYYRSLSGYSQEVIWGSKSKDLLVWEAGEGVDENFQTTYLPKVDYPRGARDPYVFYDEDVDKYRVVYLGYYNNKFYEGHDPDDFDCGLKLVTSKGNTMEYWEDEQKELLRFDNAGASKRDEPEVSQIVKIGDRWYLFASLYGQSVHGVGAMSYWMGEKNQTLDDIDFAKNGERRLDGEDVCAAQIVQVGTRFYMFGWIPKQASGNYWGGALNIAREIYQKEDGTLGSRMDPYMTDLLNKGNLFALNSNSMSSNVGLYSINDTSLIFEGNGQENSTANYKNYHEVNLPGRYNRTIITFKVKANGAKDVGVKIRNDDKTSFYTNAVLSLDSNEMMVYSKEPGGYRQRSKLSNISFKDEYINVKLVIETQYIELFINDEYSLTAKANDFDFEKFELSLFAESGSAEFKDLKVDMLSDARFAYDM